MNEAFDVSNYPLPVFPSDVNDFDIIPDSTISRFGKISIKGPMPLEYHYFGALEKSDIAGRPFVPVTLVLSKGMRVVDTAKLWKEINTAPSTGDMKSAITFGNIGAFDIGGGIASNRVMSFCLHILPKTAINDEGVALNFCASTRSGDLNILLEGDTPIKTMGGGNGICTIVTGKPIALDATGNIKLEKGLDRLVFSVEEAKMPGKGPHSTQDPAKRLAGYCDMSNRTLNVGYFVMPMLAPDLSILYYLYPNVDKANATVYPQDRTHFPNEESPTRTVLKEWYHLSAGATLGVDNPIVMPIEEMHAFFCSDVDFTP